MECEGDACAQDIVVGYERQLIEAVVSISKSLEEQTREMKRQTKALKDLAKELKGLSTEVKGLCR
jgi:hypothetical protein